LHHALDFLLASHERVELALTRELREIAAELVEDGRAARTFGVALLAAGGTLSSGFLAGLTGHHLDHLRTHPRHVRAEVAQDLGRDAVALANQAEQHVLGTDVGVAELEGFAE